MILSSLLFVVGLMTLLFSGDLLTRSSLRLATLLGMSPLAAGLTITAFATSAPEAVINFDAAFYGFSDIILGNVIGSNIANILLVLGLAASFTTLETKITHIRRYAIAVSAVSALLILLSLTGEINILSGILFLSLLAAWLIYSFKIKMAPPINENIHTENTHTPSFNHASSVMPSWGIPLLGLLLAALGLWIGAELSLNNARNIATKIGISEAVTGLILLAIGTSLPELATSFAALWRKQGAVALGNILGSNLFNILFVLGLSAVILPLPLSSAFLQLDLPVMLIATMILLPLILTHRPLRYPVGLSFLFLYALYLYSLITIRPGL